MKKAFTIFFSVLLFYTYSMEEVNTPSEPIKLDPEITNIISTSIINKNSSPQEILYGIEDILAFLKANSWYWQQRGIILDILKNSIDFSEEYPFNSLDVALKKAIKTSNLESIPWLIKAGAMICREPDDQSCDMLIKAVEKNKKKRIAILLKTFQEIIKINKSNAGFEFAALNAPYQKARVIGSEGTGRYISFRTPMKPNLLAYALKSNDKDLIKYVIKEANKYGLPEIIREILLPTIPTDAALVTILKAPFKIQKYLLKQAKKAEILSEMLIHRIRYHEKSQLTLIDTNMLGYAILELAHEPDILDTIENLLEFGKKVGVDQVSEQLIIGNQRHSLKDSLIKIIGSLAQKFNNKELSFEELDQVKRDFKTYNSILKLLNVYS